MISGIINIYKEAGFTSHDVVAKMRGILKQKKIGHTGTLDPEAVGVLPVCLGKATKVCDLLTEKDKTYRCVMQLGITTDTQDGTGNILCTSKVEAEDTDIREAILSFQGDYEQLPPMYSALKVNGKKLYELAREGKEVERKLRRVKILGIKIEEMHLPYVTMEVSCSKGTYIRTLCHDIGQKLGCGAVMQTLCRTRVADFLLEDSITLDTLEELVKTNTLSNVLQPIDSVFQQLPKLTVKPEFQKAVENGNRIPLCGVDAWDKNLENTNLRLYDGNMQFIGIFSYQPALESLKPVKIFYQKDIGYEIH